jgi:hypothetical protein
VYLVALVLPYEDVPRILPVLVMLMLMLITSVCYFVARRPVKHFMNNGSVAQVDAYVEAEVLRLTKKSDAKPDAFDRFTAQQAVNAALKTWKTEEFLPRHGL